jgi:hypothetical protein
MNCRLHNVVQLICRGTTKTLLTQNEDNLWACMLQGKTYDCTLIECLVSIGYKGQETKKSHGNKKT